MVSIHLLPVGLIQRLNELFAKRKAVATMHAAVHRCSVFVTVAPAQCDYLHKGWIFIVMYFYDLLASEFMLACHL